MTIITIGKVFDGYYVYNNKGKIFRTSEEFIAYLKTLPIETLKEQMLSYKLLDNGEDAHFCFRNSDYLFGKVSYEIIEQCNYACEHCYLDKTNRNIDFVKQEKIADILDRLGVVFVQITGGEPMMSKHFKEIYSRIYSKGFIITLMTNGYFLNDYVEVFTKKPPYKLSLSLYGSTARTYDSFVKKIGAFDRLISNLELYKNTGLNIETKIIVTKYNQNNIDDMIKIASQYGSYYVYYHLDPKLDGKRVDDLLCMNEQPDKIIRNRKKCLAGKTFFNINCQGRASICKLSRDPNIDILNDEIKKLNNFYDEMESTCSDGLYKDCGICLPKCLHYKKAGIALCSKL